LKKAQHTMKSQLDSLS